MRKQSYWIIQLNNNENAADVMAKASKYGLMTMHKIGIYEDKQTHELFIQGRLMSYLSFMLEFNKSRK